MYQWNKHELLAKKLLASILRKPLYKEHYDLILRQIKLEQEKFKPDDILVNTKSDSINFNQALANFSSGLEYLSEDTYTSLAEIFIMIEDHNAFNKKSELPPLNLTDKELIDIVREMVHSFNIKEFNGVFEKIANPTLHRLNIQKNNLKYTAGTLQYVGGITLNDPLFDKSYINIFRNYTIEDVEVLFREVMHAIFYSILRPIYTKDLNNIYLLQELEGQYGSLYAFEYLSKLGFKNEMTELKHEYINSIITTSYLFIINHVLFATSRNQTFNLKAAEDQINEQLRIPICIKESELSTYLTMNGFESLTTLISQLIALEIINKDIPLQEQIQLLYDIKANDSLHLDENLDKFEVNFKEDNFKTLRKTYQELHK